MSIQVPLDDLAAEVAKRGAGYLLTTSADSRPHVMQLRFIVEDDKLRSGVGRSAAANIAAQAAVTLLWPPDDDGEHIGYSLIVDGEAAIDTAADGSATASITAINAVLHRPA